MSATPETGRARLRPRRVRVGIVDLIASRPTRSPYKRLMNPNYASVMPQAVAAWAEQLGHEVHYRTYTGFEDLRAELPDDVEIVFLSAFTPAAWLAYSVSNLFRKRGVVTVLGGPHARAYPEDATRHFDYVAGFTDKALVRDLLRDVTRRTGEGLRVSAPGQPAELPSLRERWKFVEQVQRKARLLRSVALIGSLGCPYTCEFCIDSQVPYRSLPYDGIREDLRFIRGKFKRPVVGWHDPNFGVRFDDYMRVIDDAIEPGSVRFVAECSLSLLAEPRLKELARRGFEGLTIGIESWFDFNGKARQGSRSGAAKMVAVAEHVDLVTRHIPYVQANFVWGLDQDAGDEPFALTRGFLDRAPAAFPSHNLFTAYGDSAPLSVRLRQEGRLLGVPFPLQDTSSIHNVRLRNYSAAEFYGRMAGLARHCYSPGAVLRRFDRNPHRWSSAARWMNVARSIGESWRVPYYARMKRLFESDEEMQGFASGSGGVLPARFREKIRRDLGPFAGHLPPAALES